MNKYACTCVGRVLHTR